jgi:hypothetical protein
VTEQGKRRNSADDTGEYGCGEAMPLGRRGIELSLKARKARVRAVQSRADARAEDSAPIVRKVQSDGVTSLVDIAAAFNERSIPTATGQGNWHAVRVSRVLARLGV